MPDLTVEYARACESCFEWVKYVEGSRGDTYAVIYGPTPNGRYQYGWSCGCPAFKFHPSRPCKHIKAVQHTRCAWGEEAFAGTFSPANPDGTCPKCGGPTRVIRVAV